MSAVYIVTRARHDNLRKVVPRWLVATPGTIPIVLVTDKSEAAGLQQLSREEHWFQRGDVRVKRLRYDRRGVGYARHEAVSHAYGQGHRTIIMADDDIMPRAGESVNRLLRSARWGTTLGVGATHSQHDLLTGGYTKDHTNVILCPSGYGFQLFALNVENAIAAGNYDVALDCFGEDAELMRNGISLGIPWKLHCGVKCQKIGKRGDYGGIQSLYNGYNDNRVKAERRCQELIHERWPDFTSTPPKPSRMAWQRFYDHYIPEWRRYSAMHGGGIFGQG